MFIFKKLESENFILRIIFYIKHPYITYWNVKAFLSNVAFFSFFQTPSVANVSNTAILLDQRCIYIFNMWLLLANEFPL